MDTFIHIRKPHFFILITFWSAVHLILYSKYGFRSLEDADNYVQAADLLINDGNLSDKFNFFYIFHIVVIAVFRVVFPNQIWPVIIFQCMLSGLAAVALYRVSARAFKNDTAGLISALLFLGWWDNIHWNITTMTESLSCSVTCLLIFCLSEYNGSRAHRIKILILLVVSMFIRPTGILMILGVMGYMVTYYWSFLQQHRKFTWALLLVVALLFFAVVNLMFTSWDFTEQYAKGNIVTYVDQYKGSEDDIRNLRVEPHNIEFLNSSHPPMVKILLFIYYNPQAFFKAAVLKMWYLLSATRPYYSRIHNAANLTWMILMYALFLFGLRQSAETYLNTFILVVVIANCVLIGMSSVDWDNRFYVPMEPGIVVLAGGGLNHLIRRVSNTYLSKRVSKR